MLSRMHVLLNHYPVCYGRFGNQRDVPSSASVIMPASVRLFRGLQWASVVTASKNLPSHAHCLCVRAYRNYPQLCWNTFRHSIQLRLCLLCPEQWVLIKDSMVQVWCITQQLCFDRVCCQHCQPLMNTALSGSVLFNQQSLADCYLCAVS